jgi:hypothetical protein
MEKEKETVWKRQKGKEKLRNRERLIEKDRHEREIKRYIEKKI